MLIFRTFSLHFCQIKFVCIAADSCDSNKDKEAVLWPLLTDEMVCGHKYKYM